MNQRDLDALKLLAEIQRLTATGDPITARLTIRNNLGEWIGDVPLSANAVEALTDGTMSIADHAERPAAALYGFPTDSTPEHDETPAPTTQAGADADLDPLLIAAIEDHFAKVDPESYLDDVFGAPDAEASLAAYEQLVTGEWEAES